MYGSSVSLRAQLRANGKREKHAEIVCYAKNRIVFIRLAPTNY